MRVPLPGRDYFPARVLLRQSARPMPESLRGDPRGGLPSLRPGPASIPAAPPAPAIGMRPVAA
jgi:hypothetical protein